VADALTPQKGIFVLKRKPGFAFVAGGLLWAGLMSTNHALTLGDLRGSVLVGRQLDVSVVVQATPDEDVSATCFKAEVFHADTPQPRANVTVRPLATAGAGAYRVRIQSPTVVDEPVVTVELSSTCNATLVRRYVVLADFPVVALADPQVIFPVQEPVATVVPEQGAASQTAAPTAVASQPLAAVQIQSSVPRATVPVKSRAPKRKSPRKKPRPAAKPVVAAPGAAPVPQPAGAALKLEDVNLSPGLTDALGHAPPAAPSPEAMLQASQIAALQDELRQIKAQGVKARADLAQMQLLLQQAQSERVSLSLFYGVVAVLLMCVAVLSWLLWQRYRGSAAPVGQVGVLNLQATTVMPRGGLAQTPASDVPARTRVGTGLRAEPAVPQRWPEHDTVIATQLESSSGVGQKVVDTTSEKVDSALATSPMPESAHSGFPSLKSDEVDLDLDLSSWDALAESTAPTGMTTESSLDVRQQAEFFVSLGQTDRALTVLRKQIADGAQPDPFVYLDLLSLYHSLGYKADFREYRVAFNRHFNCVLPDFPAFHLEGLDLMSYAQELEQLAQVWQHPDVIGYLRACVYRSEQASAQPAFELAAFRDLLLLLAIAEQVHAPDS